MAVRSALGPVPRGESASVWAAGEYPGEGRPLRRLKLRGYTAAWTEATSVRVFAHCPAPA